MSQGRIDGFRSMSILNVLKVYCKANSFKFHKVFYSFFSLNRKAWSLHSCMTNYDATGSASKTCFFVHFKAFH